MSTCKGTNICEFAKQRFIYKSIYDMICVLLSMYVRIETGLQSVSTFHRRGNVSSQNMGSYTKVSVI